MPAVAGLGPGAPSCYSTQTTLPLPELCLHAQFYLTPGHVFF